MELKFSPQRNNECENGTKILQTENLQKNGVMGKPSSLLGSDKI